MEENNGGTSKKKAWERKESLGLDPLGHSRTQCLTDHRPE